MQQYEPNFRAHHILCTSLYEGKGYSGAFCDNMTAVVGRLRLAPDTMLRLAASPDLICANCPNHDGAGHCMQNGSHCMQNDSHCMQNGSHVAEKDRALMIQLHLKEGGVYTYRVLCEHAYQYLTEDFFETSCGKCEWKRQGLCDYRDLMGQLSKISRILRLTSSSY